MASEIEKNAVETQCALKAMSEELKSIRSDFRAEQKRNEALKADLQTSLQ
jgi:hypothetical protein